MVAEAVAHQGTIRETLPHGKTTFIGCSSSSFGRLNNISDFIHPLNLVTRTFSLQDNSTVCWKEKGNEGNKQKTNIQKFQDGKNPLLELLNVQKKTQYLSKQFYTGPC